MPPFIPITNINAIVSDCFHDYYGPGNPACVLRDVVPILWFGDMDAYWASEKKIVTVAVNPSDKEFIVNGVCSINNRFPGALPIMTRIIHNTLWHIRMPWTVIL